MLESENASARAESDIGNAVRFALLSGASAAIGAALPATANAQAASTPAATGNDELQEVVVTGSRIRRVDAETASPILTVDSAQIEASGVQTVGELVMQLPTVSGAAVNPATNNGGGFGEANVELRGLDAKRTLVLINGRRVGLVGASGAVDVNQIPVNIIDHVEVLKEGAGAIYGSDAIGGVVNFITRKHADGLEIGGEFGKTSRNDGKHSSLGVMFGGSSDKVDFLLAGSYTKQDKVSAGDREYSKLARYLYSGTYGPAAPNWGRFEVDAGSSRIPNGRVALARGALVPGTTTGETLRAHYGCNLVMRKDGAVGTSLNDYRCYTGADAFNYQPFNLLMTPQERGSLFASLNYKPNEDTEIYTEVLMNRTHSGFQIAPLPFDAVSDDVIVSKDNIYNPFGEDFGGVNSGFPNYRLRLSTLGNRFSSTTSDSKLATLGVKGKLFSTGWEYDVNASYGRLDQTAKVNGYIYFPDLANAVGPSFLDAANNNKPTCGTVANPILNCTPINIFNTSDPTTLAALKQFATDFGTSNTYTTKTATAGVNGKLFSLPAGDVQAAFGYEYRQLSTVYEADHIVVAQPPLYIKCIISQEACTGNSSASYDDNELYGEFFVPILKDLPGAQSLNLDLGVRYSNYSMFGNSTNYQAKLEYRPISNLLIRGTYSKVFRVPTLADISAAPAISNPTYNDPCYGLTAATNVGGLALACAGTATDGSFAYNGTSQITAVIKSNPNLKPETGSVTTYGFVLQVPHIDNWSVSVDMWQYKIDDLITTLDPNYASDQCIATSNPTFCSLIHRYDSGANQGEILAFELPTLNLGKLTEKGVDIGTKYLLKNTRAGDFQFSVDTTYIDSYENTPTPGAAPQQVAGTYDNQFGNYARWRGLGTISWAKGDFTGMLAGHYIHHLVVHNPATQNGFTHTNQPNPDLKIPSWTTWDLTVGYTVPKTKTKLQLGVVNLTDRQPSVFYQNNTINADTDVSTYDTLGRRYFVTFSQKF